MIKIDKYKIVYCVWVHGKCIDVDSGTIADENDGMEYLYCDITELFEKDDKGNCLLGKLYAHAMDWEKHHLLANLERDAVVPDRTRYINNKRIYSARSSLYKKEHFADEQEFERALELAEQKPQSYFSESYESGELKKKGDDLQKESIELYHEIEDYFLSGHVGDIYVKDNTMYLVLPKHKNVLEDEPYYHQYQILPIDNDCYASAKTLTFQDVVEAERNYRIQFIPSVLKDTISKYTPPFLFQVMMDEIDYRDDFVSHLGDDWEKLDFDEKKYRYKTYCRCDERYDRIYKEISDYSSVAADAIGVLTGRE